MDNTQSRQPDDVRQAIMTAIRQQLAASEPFDRVHEENRSRHEGTLPAGTAPAKTSTSMLEEFKQSLEAVGGHCIVVQDEAQATESLRQIIEKIQAQRVGISNSPLVERVLQPLTGEVELISDAAKAELFKCDLGVTGAQWAIAETGTLALESDFETHRLVSLVPPVHVAIVEAAHMRHTLGEVLTAIDEQGPALSRTITFITGPSRTADIELTQVIGVHGPAELYVVLIEGMQA